MLSKPVMLAVCLIYLTGCAPNYYVASFKKLNKGEPAPENGYFLTDNDLKAIGDIKIDRSK